MWINNRLVDFSSVSTKHKVMPGCPRHEKVDPCEAHMCKYGKCRPLEGMSYECECRRGYSGPMCDIGESVTSFFICVHLALLQLPRVKALSTAKSTLTPKRGVDRGQR